MSNDISDVLSREIAWLNADPPPGGSYNSAPNLLAVNSGGFFNLIQADRPKVSEYQANLYLEYLDTSEERIALGEKQLTHTLRICIEWPFNNADGSWETAKTNLRNAVNAVFARLRGPFGDKTHNNKFFEAGEMLKGKLVNEAPDFGESFVYEIEYTVTDNSFTTN